MDKHTKELIWKWTTETIEKEPSIYGGDMSNPEIMRKFASDHFGESKVSQLPTLAFSMFSSVSREKNKVLKARPELDCRVRFAPKSKRRGEE